MGTIGLVTTQLQRGGAEQQLCQLAEDLVQRSIDVSVLSLMEPLSHVERLKRAGVDVTTIGMRRGLRGISLKALGRYHQWVKRQNIELGIFFNYHPILIGRLSWKVGLIPKVITSIRCERFGGGGMREWLTKVTDSWCSETTTNSELAARSLIQRGIGREMVVVRNGLDLSRFEGVHRDTEKLRTDLGVRPSEFLWLGCGRLDRQKDFGRLIEAFSKGFGDNRNARLLIAGSGNLEENLENAIERAGLKGVCQMLGERNDVPALLCAADGFVLSSAWEGLPNVTMEALAAATPVVTTDVGGTREIIDDGVTGFVVEPEDTEGLRQGMKRLMEIPRRERKEMGRLGKAMVMEKFSREASLKQWLAVIRRTGYRMKR